MKVLQFPLAQLTLTLIIGILTAYFLEINCTLAFSLLFGIFMLLIIVFFLNQKNNKYNIRYITLAYLTTFLLGVTTQVTHKESLQENHYLNNKSSFNTPQSMIFTIREKLKNTTFSQRYIAVLNNINNTKTTGKIILNIPLENKIPNLKTGTYLKINGLLVPHKEILNPNQFDYGKYLENKQIYAQLYTNDKTIATSISFKKDIWYYIATIREHIIQNLEKSGFNKRELNVAIALIMGQKQEIDPEIIQDYQYAGAIHILSVSGLHVGFLLLFLNFILKPFPNTKRGRLIKLIIQISVLMFFALLAGLSPSVVRSVTMFSFIAVGYYIRRKNSIYYTLILSIFIILLFQPNFLFEVGFQLSYLALFFILWLQPELSKIFTPKNSVLKYTWDILTVTFAAQVGTLPLSIYYFHQFPGLFFITNLFVIPLLSIIMVLGIMIFTIAGATVIPIFIIKPLEWLIYLLNKIINKIASVEQFIIKDIPLNTALLFSLYLVIITIVMYFQKPKFRQLSMMLLSIIILQFSYFKTQWDIQQQKEWIVYNSNRNTLITSRIGNSINAYGKESVLNQKRNALNNYAVANFSFINKKGKIKNTVYFNQNKILIIDSSSVYFTNSKPDILVLTESPKINLERILKTYKPKMVVSDASNYKSYQKLWKETCNKQNIPFHATAEKGYYILK